MFLIPMLAVILYVGGYFMTAGKKSNRGTLSDDLERFIAPPGWLYYLCGAPSNKEYPRGTMRAAAFRVQISGIALMIFSISSSLWKFSRWEYLIGFGLAVIAPYGLTAYILKKYFVREAIKEPIVIQKGNSMTPTKINEDLSYSIEGNSINLYSEFGSSGGANLTVDLEELDLLIETLQGIKAFMQSEQSEETGG